jgi:type IV secretory pathway TraG/TraD family ATPase VirD4
MIQMEKSMAEPRTGWTHVRIAAITLAVLLVFVVGLVAALRCAGFFYVAFAHRNPLHAGWWDWVDGVSACLQQCRPAEHRHLLGSGVLALALVFCGPLFAWVAVRNRVDTRELHGSARFATEREIRKAGLL